MTTGDQFGLRASAIGLRWPLMPVVLAAAVVAMLLVTFASADHYTNDAAQYLSGVYHLLAGDGLRTSAIYFEVQANQGVPAIQTVWPPGLPLVVAAVVWLTGLDAITATVFTNALAHAATACLIAWIMLKLSLNRVWSIAVGICYAAYVPAWRLVLSGLAEPIYLLLIAASLAALMKAFDEGKDAVPAWLAIAASCIGMGAWFRYQAIFHIVPLGLLILYAFLRRDSAIRAVLRTSLVCLPGALIFLVLIARNWLVAGSLSGAGSSSTSNSLSDLVSQGLWVVLNLLGVVDGLTKLAAVAVLVLVALWSIFYAKERGSNFRLAFDMRGATAFYAISGGLFTAAVIVGLALRSNFYLLEARYFLSSGILFLIGLYALSASFGRTAAVPRFSRILGIAAGTSVVLLLAAQVFHFVSRAGAPGESALIRQHLATPYRDGTVASFLKASASSRSPVLSNQSQLLHIAIGRATFGIPERRLTARTWGSEDIYAVARRLGVSHAVIFKTMPLGAKDGTTDYVWRLARSRQGWLSPLLETDQIVLYRIVDRW
ncbi:MAG: hypothetical protein RLZ98_1159 [Pseudomonadota bacterium]|jgi:hypothetical protein